MAKRTRAPARKKSLRKSRVRSASAARGKRKSAHSRASGNPGPQTRRRKVRPLGPRWSLYSGQPQAGPVYGDERGCQSGPPRKHAAAAKPHKPGRPSHAYHSYFMANTRLCFGVEVHAGKEHAARHALPGLWALLDSLPRTHWPTMLRGDCGYGQEAGDGWEVMESTLRLSGWSRARRVVLVREKPALAPVGAQARRRRDYFQALPGSEQWPAESAPWAGRIAVLVTTLEPRAYPAQSLAGLYRERADAENVHDELKNQWGWNGFTTQKLAPCRLMANLVPLVYNPSPRYWAESRA